MEHKLNEVIACKFKGKTIYLEVTNTKDNTCRGCFFDKNSNSGYCETVRNIIGDCDNRFRSDNLPIIFRKVNKFNILKLWNIKKTK